MSTEYVKTSWQDGDIITADKMNNIENGIKDVEDTATSLKEDLSDIEEITVKTTEHTETTDITSDLTFTDGYMNTSGETGASSNYKYTNKINVTEGDVILSGSRAYNLRYVTAYNGDAVVSAKGTDNVSTYTVPSEIDSVVVTIYSAVGTTSNAILHTVTVIDRENILNDTIDAIDGKTEIVKYTTEIVKNNTVRSVLNPSDVSSSLTFTDGFINKSGEIGSSSSYKYSNKITVNEGDIIVTQGWSYPFRYVTAYSGNIAIAEKSAENVFDYTVPSGVDSVVCSIYAVQSGADGVVTKIPSGNYTNLLFGANAYKQVGTLEKAYICLSCDDGADELATYTIPMIQSKGVPCTFGLYKDSDVFLHGYTQRIVDAVNNYNCEVAQHGGQHSWTDYNAKELVAFFDDEELFWKRIGVTVKSAIYPTHLSNPMVRAITGSRFGCCRSGYNYDGILYYTDESKPSGTMPYYGTGARSNMYAMSAWNMPAGKDLQFTKDCIDWAIANNKLIHFYWHDWDLDSVSKQVLEDAIDYAKTQNINFIKLSEVPYIK